jgi:CHAT domain
MTIVVGWRRLAFVAALWSVTLALWATVAAGVIRGPWWLVVSAICSALAVTVTVFAGGARRHSAPDDEHSGMIQYRYEDPDFEPIQKAAAEDVAAVEEDDKFFAGDVPARPESSTRRYLKGQCPQTVPVDEPFSLLASIVQTESAGAALKPFTVPATGRDVLLVVHAPGMQLLGPQRQAVHVPESGDSEPVMFELRAETPGPRPVSITAWLGGNYLGELVVEVTADRFGSRGPSQDAVAEVATEYTDGAVSLVVRYDPGQQLYRFEFRDEDYPDEVTSHLAYDPGPQVEQLVAGLDDLAKDRSGYSPAETREYLLNVGAGLWQELVPAELREQFWQRQHRIRQLTILTDKDVIPWELLYPKDPGHDAGFLVQQFPVTRAVFGHRPPRQLKLWPAQFVLPDRSPSEAQDEINALRRLFGEERPEAVISALTPLLDTIRKGDFGLLHFACHNSYDPVAGSSIRLDDRQFTPTLLNTAVIDQVLARSTPVIFINACRSAGVIPKYNNLDSWASKFLQAGAAAFIGSLWAVSDDTAPRFARKLYSQLTSGTSLGEAVMQARNEALSQGGEEDPTWLAYTVYGNPLAKTTRSEDEL